jgi:TRAP-type mannitol/chloroaromatic compound transport system permease small subunit
MQQVLNVAIIYAHSNQEHVRVDVTFENKDSAVETIKMFDWRMFGDKQIIAKMCDER